MNTLKISKNFVIAAKAATWQEEEDFYITPAIMYTKTITNKGAGHAISFVWFNLYLMFMWQIVK